MTPRTTFELIPAVRDSIPYVPPPDPVARLRNEVGWFWMDIPVVAKHHVRGLPTTAEEMRSLQAVIGHVAEYLGLQPQATGHDNLRRLAGEMDELLSHTRAAPFRCRDREFAWRWIQFSEWATDASGGQKESIAPEQ